MLQIDRAHHIHAVRANLFHILPAMRMAAARRIILRHLVDQTHLRRALQNRFHVQRVRVANAQRRNNLELPDQILHILQAFPLDHADDNVLPALLPAPPLVEHPQGLADARSVSQKDLQPPARIMGFLRLDLAQQFFRIGAAEFFRGHILSL